MSLTPALAPLPALPARFADRLRAELGPAFVLTDPDLCEPFLIEERGHFRSRTAIVLTPGSMAELSRTVALCAAEGVPMVPIGGNTGLVGGAVAQEGEVLVSLKRMNRILAIDPVNYTMTVEAGCILADIQSAAAEAGCLFPLSLGAEGSCTIGGNIASNAGGTGVLKYGNTRDLVMGLEVVLPDGQVWDGLRPLIKDNSGYSLKNLFVGSEGSLGFVTRAVLKLFPRPMQQETALCALASVDKVLALLSLARRQSGDAVTLFEMMARFPLEIVCRHAGGRDPFEHPYPWYALIQLGTPRPGSDLRAQFEEVIETAWEQGLIADAVIAESLAQTQALTQLREKIPEAQKRAGGSIKHDISVPVARFPDFVTEASAAVLALMPDANVCAFGHVGDGNVHFNITQPEGADRAAFLARWSEVNAAVHGVAASMQGAISAEHGVGLLKRDELEAFRAPVETQMMRAIKVAFDPRDLMNRGKLITSG
jgi:D-lactate dehydrogenase (cytochrome)